MYIHAYTHTYRHAQRERERDPEKLRLARHNAAIYGMLHKIRYKQDTNKIQTRYKHTHIHTQIPRS